MKYLDCIDSLVKTIADLQYLEMLTIVTAYLDNRAKAATPHKAKLLKIAFEARHWLWRHKPGMLNY